MTFLLVDYIEVILAGMVHTFEESVWLSVVGSEYVGSEVT